MSFYKCAILSYARNNVFIFLFTWSIIGQMLESTQRALLHIGPPQKCLNARGALLRLLLPLKKAQILQQWDSPDPAIRVEPALDGTEHLPSRTKRWPCCSQLEGDITLRAPKMKPRPARKKGSSTHQFFVVHLSMQNMSLSLEKTCCHPRPCAPPSHKNKYYRHLNTP